MKHILYSVILTTAIAASVSACAPTTQRPLVDPKASAEEQDRQLRAAVNKLVAYRERLHSVGLRVLTAAKPMCKETEQRATKLKHKPSQFPKAMQAKAAEMGYTEEDDASAPRVEACKMKMGVAVNHIVNAYADGSSINLFTGMMDFARTDDELALVFAHELAHNSMGHLDAKRGNAVAGAVVGGILSVLTGVNMTQLGADVGGAAFSQDFESEADYVGLYVMARAGYSIDVAPDFWARMGEAQPGAITHASSHPSTADRAVQLRKTIEEIEVKRLSGVDLMPNLAPREPGKETQTGWGKPAI